MDALYFPYLSLPDPSWTYPNLLFFDHICVMAPSGDRHRLFDGPTRALQDYGLVRTIDPTRYAGSESEDAQVLAYLTGVSQTKRRDQDFGRIHLGKFAYGSLVEELSRIGFLKRRLADDGYNEWLEGPVWVINYLMSIFAARILAARDDLPLITDEISSSRLIAGKAVQGESSNRRVKALARLLPLGPGAEIADIARFKEGHQRELQQFREFITYLITRDRRDGMFEIRLREAERLRTHLVEELSAIRSAIPPVQIGLAIASVAAPLAEHSPYSAAVGVLGLGYLVTSWAARHRRERAIMNDKLVFAALADQRFAPRHSGNVLG
ncbi:hypothetical protein ACCS99_20055 [Rhizobium ruizarguesonis]